MRALDAEERANALTHLVGAGLALTGLVGLLAVAARGDAWRLLSLGVYGAALVAVYASSTLYHAVGGRPKAVFRKLDHCAIYLLIAGTYTPFALLALGGGWGWTIFSINWSLAAAGIALELTGPGERRILSVVLYLVMGWLALVAAGPFLRALPPAGLVWLLAGGVCYTGGIAFYALDERIPYGHAVWHLFVLAGSASHYVAVARSVV